MIERKKVRVRTKRYISLKKVSLNVKLKFGYECSSCDKTS